MESVLINLTLNGETRQIEALKIDKSEFPRLYVYRIAMITRTGTKTHLGTIGLKYVEGKTDYTAKDITYANYSGMRGNGHAARSYLRYIGFPEIITDHSRKEK